MFKFLVVAAVAYAVYQLFSSDDRDDPPPSRSQPYEPSVHRRDERQHQDYVGSYQRDRIQVEPPDYAYPRAQRIDSYQKARTQVKASDHAYLRAQNVDSYEGAHSPVKAFESNDTYLGSQRIDSQKVHLPVEATDYASLRAEARQEGELMSQCRRLSQEAYNLRHHVRAKALAEEGKRHQSKMERLDAAASTIVFEENNRDGHGRRVDLHGLYVKEAIAYSAKAVADARRRRDSEIRLIVGQGNHSEGGISRLKPAIQEDMQSRGHRVEVDPRNPGVLLVRLG